MSVKVVKIQIIPVTQDSLNDHLVDVVYNLLGDAAKILDEYGAKYQHEVPWNRKFLCDPKFYLFRVQVGAIGRIQFCKDAIELGLKTDVVVKTNYFVNTALYNITRLARQVKRQYTYLEKVEKWVNCFLQGKSPNSRFLEDEMYV